MHLSARPKRYTLFSDQLHLETLELLVGGTLELLVGDPICENRCSGQRECRSSLERPCKVACTAATSRPKLVYGKLV